MNLSASIILPLKEKNYLTGGFRFGGMFHRIKTTGLRYDEQFDGQAGFDQSIPGEFDDLEQLSSQMLNIGGGLSYNYLGRDLGVNAGLALDHIFLPVRYDLIDSDDLPTLVRKWTLHMKVSFLLSQKKNNTFALNINSILMRQNPYQQLVGGADLVFQNKENFTISIGGGLRTTRSFSNKAFVDAVLANLSINYDRFTFSFNYDINTSNLQIASNGYGAFELGVIYRWKKSNSNCSPVLAGCKLDSKNTHPIFF